MCDRKEDLNNKFTLKVVIAPFRYSYYCALHVLEVSRRKCQILKSKEFHLELIWLSKKNRRFTQELNDFVSIPSVSAQDEHFADVVDTGNWVVKALLAAGISHVRSLPTKPIQKFWQIGCSRGRINPRFYFLVILMCN